MKTIIVTSIAAPEPMAYFQSQMSLDKTIDNLPDAVRREKLFQLLLQTMVMGPDLDGYGFYENSDWQSTRTVSADVDPVGSGTVRIDYDPNNEDIIANTGPVFAEETAFGWALNMIVGLNDPERNPPNTGIECVRVTLVVEPGCTMTRSYWPAMKFPVD